MPPEYASAKSEHDGPRTSGQAGAPIFFSRDVAAFRTAAIAALGACRSVTLAALEEEHAKLAARLRFDGDEAVALWTALGVPDASRVPDRDVAGVLALGAH